MQFDILELMNGEGRAMAWLGAVALAAGGTAIVVALYIQAQRLSQLVKGRRKRPAPRAVPAAKPVATPPAAPAEDSGHRLNGMATYRRQADESAAPAAAMEALEGILDRLRDVSEALGDLAQRRRGSAAAPAHDAVAPGLDVEYLHRQT